MDKFWLLLHGITQNFTFNVFTIGKNIDAIGAYIDEKKRVLLTVLFTIFVIVNSGLLLHGI